MSKLTDKEKQAHYRQKIAKEYKDRFNSLRNENSRLLERNFKLEEENKSLVRLNNKIELENKELRKLTNLSEDEIKILVEKAKIISGLDSRVGTLFGSRY